MQRAVVCSMKRAADAAAVAVLSGAFPAQAQRTDLTELHDVREEFLPDLADVL